MDFKILSGQRAGKSERQWQYVLQAAREHLLNTGQPYKTLVIGFFPGKPEVQVTITFEIVKKTETRLQLISDDPYAPES